VWDVIVSNLNHPEHREYINEWEDETLGLYYRMMDSPTLQMLHQMGDFEAMRYFVLKGVAKAKLNALRRQRGKVCQMMSSLQELEETFNVGYLQALLHMGEAANDCGVSVDLDDISALAHNEDRLRHEVDFRVEALDVLLEETPDNRKIFLAKTFSRNTSACVARWLSMTETTVNNRYHATLSRIRKRVC